MGLLTADADDDDDVDDGGAPDGPLPEPGDSTPLGRCAGGGEVKASGDVRLPLPPRLPTLAGLCSSADADTDDTSGDAAADGGGGAGNVWAALWLPPCVGGDAIEFGCTSVALAVRL